MRIQHNLTAYSAGRFLSMNELKTSKSIEKLSSGYRINRAGDDAAGLAISEKMRALIRGLSMAQKNVQDGISLIQTAEGALQGTHNILQRMRELAVQAASDTNESFIDRAALGMEYRELINEINQVANTTSFNNIKLLDGNMSANAGQAISSSQGIAATQVSSTPVNWSSINGKDYSALAADIQGSIVPSIINQMASILPSLSSQAVGDIFNSAIQIGMSSSRGGTSYASVSYSWSLSPDKVSLNLNINLDEVDKLWKNGNFVDDDARSEFEAMMAHELTHAVMAISTTVGMASPDSYPGWFKEGMAQTMSGDMGWIGSLTGSSTDAEIQSLLKYSALTKNDSSSKYASGYLAVMYMAWEASGEGAVTGTNLANGINRILSELASGKSLDTVIKENTDYNGLADFERNMGMAQKTSDFVRALRIATGSGNGSVLSQDLTDTDLVANGAASSTFLKVDTNNAWVTNLYQPGYSPGYGGSAYIDGNPVNYIGSDPHTYIPGTGGYSSTNGPLIIQSGANTGDTTSISIEKMDADSIGLLHEYGFLERPLSGTGILSQDSASIAIDVVNGAINMVSSQRAALGAMQNRLEHKMKGLAITEESLTNAESRIRDMDMAIQMTEFTKNNILSDAARAMLAQANQLPQSVLNLLS